jgi:homoserine kinase type II
MSAYTKQRELTVAENRHWNLVLRAAALRFWLSRLQDKHFPREGELTQIKNPDAFLKILRQHQQRPLIVNVA